MFGLGPTEFFLLVVVAIVLLSPLVAAGVVLWIMFLRRDRNRRE